MISAPKGITSVISGIMEGDYSVIPHQKGAQSDLQIAEAQVQDHELKLKECKSDWSYWSILGDLTYWTAIRDILKGADMVGPTNMPEVRFESKSIMVMDHIAEVEAFGKEVLEACQILATT